ncbi:hypothetical protein GUJ93_ZPchr0006g44160 [Zizania palustris]|uniref:Uncharacterized protein n=1 Tax=Zizania palustris TaxID=103762 RepID=A0A8J5SCF1_ZIZPA|nr:hypothetical protein GUJ93_ZPchr0006g44160 [Zizania palustris]
MEAANESWRGGEGEAGGGREAGRQAEGTEAGGGHGGGHRELGRRGGGRRERGGEVAKGWRAEGERWGGGGKPSSDILRMKLVPVYPPPGPAQPPEPAHAAALRSATPRSSDGAGGAVAGEVPGRRRDHDGRRCPSARLHDLPQQALLVVRHRRHRRHAVLLLQADVGPRGSSDLWPSEM